MEIKDFIDEVNSRMIKKDKGFLDIFKKEHEGLCVYQIIISKIQGEENFGFHNRIKWLNL